MGCPDSWDRLATCNTFTASLSQTTWRFGSPLSFAIATTRVTLTGSRCIASSGTVFLFWAVCRRIRNSMSCYRTMNHHSQSFSPRTREQLTPSPKADVQPWKCSVSDTGVLGISFQGLADRSTVIPSRWILRDNSSPSAPSIRSRATPSVRSRGTWGRSPNYSHTVRRMPRVPSSCPCSIVKSFYAHCHSVNTLASPPRQFPWSIFLGLKVVVTPDRRNEPKRKKRTEKEIERKGKKRIAAQLL
jgi:hypothetical protein